MTFLSEYFIIIIIMIIIIQACKRWYFLQEMKI